MQGLGHSEHGLDQRQGVGGVSQHVGIDHDLLNRQIDQTGNRGHPLSEVAHRQSNPTFHAAQQALGYARAGFRQVCLMYLQR